MCFMYICLCMCLHFWCVFTLSVYTSCTVIHTCIYMCVDMYQCVCAFTHMKLSFKTIYVWTNYIVWQPIWLLYHIIWQSIKFVLHFVLFWLWLNILKFLKIYRISLHIYVFICLICVKMCSCSHMCCFCIYICLHVHRCGTFCTICLNIC